MSGHEVMAREVGRGEKKMRHTEHATGASKAMQTHVNSSLWVTAQGIEKSGECNLHKLG